MIALKVISRVLLVVYCTNVFSVHASNVEDIGADSIDEEYVSYTYWRGGMSEGRKHYETELLQLLLDLSEAKFGKVRLEFLDETFSFPRGMVDMGKGGRFHIQSGPYISSQFNHKYAIYIKQPILNNLLGFRRLIVNKTRYDEIRLTNTVGELSTLKAGMVKDWQDAQVFKHNNLQVEEAKVYKSLYKMLARNRFDYLPLGAGEIEISLRDQGGIQDQLKIVDNIVLYYPWPVYFFVAKTTPELADRLRYAFEVAEKTKQLDQLFWRHYAELIDSMNKATTTVFVLENNKVKKTDQNRLPTLLDKANIIEMQP